jgi:hypothetical protein
VTPEEFKISLTSSIPPEVSPLLKAMWYDEKGDWNKAHDIAQEIHTPEGSWVHAYLHRKEGDQYNARYWYSRAGKRMPAYSMQQEWEEMITALIAT